MQRRSIIINLVRDDYAHEKFYSYKREARLCPKTPGSLQCFPRPLAGFRGKGGTPENGLRREGKRTGGK